MLVFLLPGINQQKGKKATSQGPLNSMVCGPYDQIMEIRKGEEWKIVTKSSWFDCSGKDNKERKIGKKIFEMRGNEAEMQKMAKLPQRNKDIGLSAF